MKRCIISTSRFCKLKEIKIKPSVIKRTVFNIGFLLFVKINSRFVGTKSAYVGL